MDLDPCGEFGIGAAEIADHLLDAGVMSAQSKLVTPASTKAAMSLMAIARSTSILWPVERCHPPFRIREMVYPGLISMRSWSWTLTFRIEWHRGRRGVTKPALSKARDPEPAGAVWVRTGDVRVCAHPVVGMGLALFCREHGHDGGQGIDRETLACRQMKHFAAQLEESPTTALHQSFVRPPVQRPPR